MQAIPSTAICTQEIEIKKLNIDNLPIEILENIFRYVAPFDLSSLRGTCKVFQRVVTKSVWKKVLVNFSKTHIDLDFYQNSILKQIPNPSKSVCQLLPCSDASLGESYECEKQLITGFHLATSKIILESSDIKKITDSLGWLYEFDKKVIYIEILRKADKNNGKVTSSIKLLLNHIYTATKRNNLDITIPQFFSAYRVLGKLDQNDAAVCRARNAIGKVKC